MITEEASIVLERRGGRSLFLNSQKTVKSSLPTKICMTDDRGSGEVILSIGPSYHHFLPYIHLSMGAARRRPPPIKHLQPPSWWGRGSTFPWLSILCINVKMPTMAPQPPQLQWPQCTIFLKKKKNHEKGVYNKIWKSAGVLCTICIKIMYLGNVGVTGNVAISFHNSASWLLASSLPPRLLLTTRFLLWFFQGRFILKLKNAITFVVSFTQTHRQTQFLNKTLIGFIFRLKNSTFT